jgi:hypothetical protein
MEKISNELIILVYEANGSGPYTFTATDNGQCTTKLERIDFVLAAIKTLDPEQTLELGGKVTFFARVILVKVKDMYRYDIVEPFSTKII